MTTKVRAARAKKDVKRALRKIDPKEVREILENESEGIDKKVRTTKALSPGETNPGTSTKVPWTWKELCARYPMVSIHPQETYIITWNGIPFQLIAGAEHYVPEPFKDAYNHNLANRRKTATLRTNMGFETIAELGAGPLEPE